MTRPAAFLDRDGVLNVDRQYVCRQEDFAWIAGAIETIKALNEADYLVIVITNQSGIARGYYDEAAVQSLHAWMNDELSRHGAHIDAFYYCPHHHDGVVQDYTRACDSRKPGPGMFLRAMKEWQVRREGSFTIGDKETDIEAGRRAGIPAYLFPGGNLKTFVDPIISLMRQPSAPAPSK